MNDFLQLARDRYSVRKFDPSKPVSEEQLESILRAAEYAPTAVNYQPVKVWVFRTAENKEKLISCTKMKFIGDAPFIIAVGAKAEGAWVRPFDQKNFSEIDASIVATHIMLEIHDLGLGSTWIGHFDAPTLKTLFPEMADYELVALFPVGYAAEDAAPSERHEKSKPAAELFGEL